MTTRFIATSRLFYLVISDCCTGPPNHIILCNPKDAEFYGLFGSFPRRNTVARLLRMKLHFTVKTKLNRRLSLAEPSGEHEKKM